MLDPVLERMMEAVHRYEGTVNQVMGDGIMALFGAPLAHEDHAVRACYAALRMHEAIRRYAEEVRRTHGVEVQIRVGHQLRRRRRPLDRQRPAHGLHGGRADDAPRRADGAARAPRHDPDHRATRCGLPRTSSQVKPLGPIPVKGLAAARGGLRADRGRRRADAAAGRRRRAASRASSGGTPRWSSSGSARRRRRGATGRSSPSSASRASASRGSSTSSSTRTGRHGVAAMLEASSVSYGKATPFLPLVDLLARLLPIDDRDDTRSVRAKVTGTLLTLDRRAQGRGARRCSGSSTSSSPATRSSAWSRRNAAGAPSRRQARAPAREPRAAAAARVRGPALDRRGDAGRPRRLVGEPGERARPARRELPSRVPHGWGSKTYYRQLRIDPLPPASADALLRAAARRRPSPPRRSRRFSSTAPRATRSFSRRACARSWRRGVLVGERGAYRLVPIRDDDPGAGHGPGHPGRAHRSPAARGQAPAPGGRP